MDCHYAKNRFFTCINDVLKIFIVICFMVNTNVLLITELVKMC